MAASHHLNMSSGVFLTVMTAFAGKSNTTIKSFTSSCVA